MKVKTVSPEEAKKLRRSSPPHIIPHWRRLTTVRLKDGTALRGSLQTVRDDAIVLSVNGRTYDIALHRVYSYDDGNRVVYP